MDPIDIAIRLNRRGMSMSGVGFLSVRQAVVRDLKNIDYSHQFLILKKKKKKKNTNTDTDTNTNRGEA